MMRMGRLAMASIAMGGLTASTWRSDTTACGIVAYIGTKPDDDALKYLLEGLTILQNRGYDSAGVATVSADKGITCTKYASHGSTSDSINILKENAPERHVGDLVGIAHTRWATHGGKTDENAHPHCDSKNRIAVVHNGTIENYAEMKKMLIEKGFTFKSQTDTEVIANLISMYMDDGLSTLKAVERALSRLSGTWGLCVASVQSPNELIVARNGSPICVGIDTAGGRMFVASEHNAFGRYTNSYIALKDGEIAVIRPNDMSLDISRAEVFEKQEIILSPAPFAHWTIREIHEQPSAVSRALNYGGRMDAQKQIRLGGLDGNIATLSTIDNLLISACGTSLFAARYGAQVMRYLDAFRTVDSVDAAEMSKQYFPRDHPGLLVISQSGETKDVHRAVVLAEELGIPRFSVINSVGSHIARTTKCGVYLNAGIENAVASTKAFITQITVLCLVAGWFSQLGERKSSQRRDELLTALLRLPTYTGMMLTRENQMKEIAIKYKDAKDMFVLGKGFGEPIAREAALKIKEITYLHAEGLEATNFTHGPLAVLEEGMPVVLFILDDDHASEMIKIASQIRARRGRTIVVTDRPSMVIDVADELITIPYNGPLTAVLGIVPMQLLAYHLALQKGIDPDKPKNLAKSVTTD